MKLTFSKAEKSLSRSEDTKFSLDEAPGGWGNFGSYRMSGEETAQAWGPIAMERVCKGADKAYIMGGIRCALSFNVFIKAYLLAKRMHLDLFPHSFVQPDVFPLRLPPSRPRPPLPGDDDVRGTRAL